MNKRLLGYLNWCLRRGARHSKDVLQALLLDLRDVSADHVVVTGDLTRMGLADEFREAAKFLNSMGSPKDVTVIPGNHDTYVAEDWNRTLGLLEDYMVSDIPGKGEGAAGNAVNSFPSVRARKGVTLIGVSTAVPSAPFLATGTIGRRQLQRLGEALEEAGRKRRFRVVLIHHPPFRGTVSRRKGLTDGKAFRSVVAQYGAELILHGHAHRTCSGYLDTGSGHAVVMGVPSASSLSSAPGHRARYHLIDSIRKSDGWEVRLSTRVYSPAKKRFTKEDTRRLTITRSSQ